MWRALPNDPLNYFLNLFPRLVGPWIALVKAIFKVVQVVSVFTQ